MAIINDRGGSKKAYSYANCNGYNVTMSKDGVNQLTNVRAVGNVNLKLLEVFDVVCFVTPKK